MSDIVKKISQLNKEKAIQGKSLAEELFPEAAKKEPTPPEESGITNLGTLGNPNIKMAPDGTISGFQEISLGRPAAPTAPPAGGEWDSLFGGMREFTLDALGSPAEAAPVVSANAKTLDGEIHELDLDNLGAPTGTSFGAMSAPPQDPLEEERKRFIQLIAAMLNEGRYEAAVNAILQMRKIVGRPGSK
jgi:hypothetical protein